MFGFIRLHTKILCQDEVSLLTSRFNWNLMLKRIVLFGNGNKKTIQFHKANSITQTWISCINNYCAIILFFYYHSKTSEESFGIPFNISTFFIIRSLKTGGKAGMKVYLLLLLSLFLKLLYHYWIKNMFKATYYSAQDLRLEGFSLASFNWNWSATTSLFVRGDLIYCYDYESYI